MSIHENIRLYHPVNLEKYLEILKTEFGVAQHPRDENTYLIHDQPFYKPRQAEGYIFILGYNMLPLPGGLIQAVVSHPELAPDSTKVSWTQEQEMLLETTLGTLRQESHS